MKLTPLQIFAATMALVALSVIFSLPFVWMISTSLKPPDRVQSASTEVIPHGTFIDRGGASVRVRPLMMKAGKQEVQIEEGTDAGSILLVDPTELQAKPYVHWPNFTGGFQAFPFGRYLLNTLVICFFCVIGTILSSSLVAYGMTFITWRGREPLFWVMLATMMLPAQVTMLPVFLVFRSLNWIDTILPLVVPAFLGNAFFIFLLRQFYRSIPLALFEAARLDGMSELGIWARIVLPLSKPALMVVGLFTFLGSWNDFFGPLIYLHSDEKYTLSIGLSTLQGQYGSDWGRMMAMSLVMTVPIVVLFFLTQRTFIQGVKLTGIK